MGKYHPTATRPSTTPWSAWARTSPEPITLIDPQGNFGTPRRSAGRPAATPSASLTERRHGDGRARSTRTPSSSAPPTTARAKSRRTCPACLPNLLVNGTSGIAVGMATNMPTHNLVEVYEAIKLVMTKRRPKPTIDELMAVVPGPDFPSGGIVIDDGLREAYETGRGSFRIRALSEIGDVTRPRRASIVTELPYLVGPERVIARSRSWSTPAGSTASPTSRTCRIARIRASAGDRVQDRGQSRTPPGELYRLTPLEESVRRQQRGPRRGRAHHARPLRPVPPLHRPPPRRRRPAHPNTACAGPRNACTSSRAC